MSPHRCDRMPPPLPAIGQLLPFACVASFGYYVCLFAVVVNTIYCSLDAVAADARDERRHLLPHRRYSHMRTCPRP